MTDREFFEALDPTVAGIGVAVEHFRAGRAEEAKVAAARHFAERELPELLRTDAPEGDALRDAMDLADAWCRSEFPVYSEVARYPQGGIDWDNVPVEAPGRSQNDLVYSLNTLHFVGRLGQVYGFTGDGKYARACIDLLLDWIGKREPMPSEPQPFAGAGANPVWRPILASRRAEYLAQACFHLRDAASVTPEEFVALLKCLLHHSRFSRRWHSVTNGLQGQLPRQMKLGILLPEFAESQSWREESMAILRALLDDFFYPDGAYMELCYFRQQCFVEAAQLCEQYGIAIPDGFLEKLEKTFDFPVLMAKPNGLYPYINDSGNPAAYPSTTENRQARLGADFFKRTDYQFVASGGKEGEEPAVRSVFFPYAGYIVMRSDWSRDARYLLFDVGWNRGNHNHLDKLSFELSAFGANLVVDTGYGGPFRSRWRKEYYLHTAGHNTIMLDGRSQVWGPLNRSETGVRMIAKTPASCQRVVGRNFEFAAATYDYGYGTLRPGYEHTGDVEDCVNLSADLPYLNDTRDVWYPGARASLTDEYFLDVCEAAHHRKIFFAKPDYWFLVDTVEGEGRHRVESVLHFPPDAEAEVDEGMVRVRAGDVGLLIVPTNPDGFSAEIVKARDEPLQGWVPEPQHFGSHVPSPTAVLSVERELPTALGLLLMPYRDQAPDVRVSYLAGERSDGALLASQALGATISLEGNTTHFLSLAHPGQPASFGEWEWDGGFARLEVDSSDQPVRFSLVGGRCLRRSGENWIEAAKPLGWLEVEYREREIRVGGSFDSLPAIHAPRGQMIIRTDAAPDASGQF